MSSPSQSLLTLASSKLQNTLDVLERLRADLATENISVPGIVVCGSQSAGKSSVLESISDVAFPRGESMCTRCPSVVSLEVDPLITVPQAILATDALYKENRRECLLDEVDQHIRDLTDIVSPDGKITSDAIYIRIQRSSGPVLTLTDIPGITAISVAQKDVEEATTALTNKYISQDNMIVLVVIPGWDDFQNPKALRLAMDQDPGGKRTIGIVTKVDCLPSNTDIIQKIQMSRPSDVKLDKGFIAVRNRTKDEAHLTQAEVRKLEEDLFRNTVPLSELTDDQWGVKTVVEKIVELQGKVVEAFVPTLLEQLRTRIRDLEREMKNMPKMLVSDAEKQAYFMSLQYVINSSYSDLLAGKSLGDKSMNVCARFFEYANAFKATINDGLPHFLSEEYQQELAEEVTEIRGISLANFMSGPLFTSLVNKAFKIPVDDGLDSLLKSSFDLVLATLKKIIATSTKDYPRLATILTEVVNEILCDQMLRARAVIDPVMESEDAVSLTLDDNYMTHIKTFKARLMPGATTDHNERFLFANVFDFMSQAVDTIKNNLSTEADIYEMQLSLMCYATVRKERTVDTIMLVVRSFLLSGVKQVLFKKLVQLQLENYSGAMDPDTDVLKKKAKLELSLARLKSAQSQLAAVLC